MGEILYFVRWKNETHKVSGHGKPISKEAAEATARQANRIWGGDGFEHWVEPADPSPIEER